MNPVYQQLRQRARQLISTYPPADFYLDFKNENEASRHLFESDPIIAGLKEEVGKLLEDDFGHGLKHATKVTLDAGALMHIETQRLGLSPDEVNRNVIVVQCAGLLHDVKRKRSDHVVKSADFAAKVLESYPLTEGEVDHACRAIRNHEAFKKIHPPTSADCALVSDCLYDADKFRWGPDNFADTVWQMVSSSNTPLPDFIAHYPEGLKGLRKIKNTFRTKTGQKYGPQFIDMGLEIGETLLKIINEEFGNGKSQG